MRFTTTLIRLALLIPFAACSSIQVGVDHDATYDFSGKQTYSWRDGIPSPNELSQKRIVAGVEQALESSGLRKVEQGKPDLWVVSEVTGRQEVRSTGTTTSVGVSRSTSWGRVGVGTSSGNKVYEVTVGTLVLVILDGKTDEVVWRAQAEETVSNDPERTKEVINEIIGKAFANFPPSPGS
jgi:hypothetical protein